MGHGKYYEIFSRANNRNSASHLWASYILDRSTSLSVSEIRELFGGFCPISGSPVRPSSRNLWSGIQLKKASNPSEIESASIHVCCWPCVCDLQEFVKTDTVDIDTKDGRFPLKFWWGPMCSSGKDSFQSPRSLLPKWKV